MALDKENKGQAYLSGRLFAVLEKLQQEAHQNGLNRTIKDSLIQCLYVSRYCYTSKELTQYMKRAKENTTPNAYMMYRCSYALTL